MPDDINYHQEYSPKKSRNLFGHDLGLVLNRLIKRAKKRNRNLSAADNRDKSSLSFNSPATDV